MDTKVGKYQGSWSGDKERRVRKSEEDWVWIILGQIGHSL